jgi:hypothetical protein
MLTIIEPTRSRRDAVFAINHAATALVLKRRFPSVPITPLLFAVQAMELAWVALNYLGIERTTTGPTVQSVADIHLAYMPYSHSVGMAAGVAVLTWLLIEKGLGRPALGRAVALGIVSHLILDLATHGHDIVLWPGQQTPKLGLGLYEIAPFAAFVLELGFGIWCWRSFGGRALLAVVVLGNLANLSLLSASIPGPESYLGGRPSLVVSFVFAQIVVTAFLVGAFATRRAAHSARSATVGSIRLARRAGT